MSDVERARIVKNANVSANVSANANANVSANAGAGAGAGANAHARARRVARVEMEARAKAEAIVAGAGARALAAAEEAAREAREGAIARVAADVLVAQQHIERKVEREIDRTIEVAVLLAERLVGEAIAVEPARIARIAHEALKETRGARRVRIEACRDDVEALRAMVAELGADAFEVVASEELARGSLLVHTEIGRVDARLTPQLARLAEALRDAMKSEKAR